MSELIDMDRIEAANQRVLGIFAQAKPCIIDIQTAREAIPGMQDRMLLHAGPPIAWSEMCGPMRGAILGAMVYEGWANTIEAAQILADAGVIALAPCHDHSAVAPMAGIISPSMPVWVIENKHNGCRAYSNLNEGVGRTLRYGANGPDVIERLKWMQDVLAPSLRRAILASGDIETFPIIRTALQMGDECHSRNKAAMALFLQRLIPRLLGSSLSKTEIDEVLRFLTPIDYFWLNITMASCKAAWLEAESISEASIITALSRNGVQFGIRLNGRWFAAPSPVVDGHYFPGFTAADANHDIGDSAITEASGLGGFCAGGAPEVINFIGGTAAELRGATEAMYAITAMESPHFALAYLEERGTPTGIDVRKVVATGIAPFVTTGIAHRLPGIGMVGAGRVRAPLQVFEAAAKYIR